MRSIDADSAAAPAHAKARRRCVSGAALALVSTGLAGLPGLLALPAHAQSRAAASASGADFTGLRGSVVRFADVAEGRAALGADDAWIAATSSWQRACLMGVAPPAGRDAFRAWQAANVRPWSAAERGRWEKALVGMADAVNRLNLPLPPQILLVDTTGRESADTPHTRGHAVALPSATFDAQHFSDVEVLAHELFHVVSRHDPALATRLYALIGFEPVAELEWPAAWLPLRIADADAPFHRHAMRLRSRGRDTLLMPLVVASQAEIPRGEPITALMELRLLEVSAGAGRPTRAVLRGGRPVWHDPDAAPGYARRIGPNTDYTIHPEEAIADNVMFLVSGRSVPDPALLARIAAVLKSR